jgi:sialic acid synthase
LVRDLRRTSEALGDGVKVIYDNEQAPMRKMRKMIVVKHDMPAGAIVTENDIEFRSPGDGLGPDLLNSVVGKRLKISMKQFEPLKSEGLVQDI